jgi:hypothetical protein
MKYLIIMSAVIAGIIGLWVMLSYDNEAVLDEASSRNVSKAEIAHNPLEDTAGTNPDVQILLPNNQSNNNGVVVERTGKKEDVSVGEKEKYVKIAYEHAKKLMEIKDPSIATVEWKENVVIVTFPIPEEDIKRPPPRFEGDKPPRYPGPDYIARVEIDRKTGKVLKTLVGS